METAEDLYLEHWKEAPSLMNFYDYKRLATQSMIEFAKMHVKAALESVIENSYGLYYEDKFDYNPTYVTPEKDSVMRAYPLENIK